MDDFQEDKNQVGPTPAFPAPGTDPCAKEVSATETGSLLGTGQGSEGVERGSGDRAGKAGVGQPHDEGLREPLPAGQGQPAQASLSPGLYLPGIDFPACLLVVIKGCVPGVLFKRDWNLESWSN